MSAAALLVAFSVALAGPLSLVAHVFFLGRTRWLRLHFIAVAAAIMAFMWLGFRKFQESTETAPKAECTEVQCALPLEE